MHDDAGNTDASTTVMTVPKGTRIYIGGTPVALIADAVVQTHPMNVEHIKLEIECQRNPVGMSER